VSDLVALLQDFYRDKLTVYLRHQAGARLVVQYDANNTYQYIVNRDDVQLTWIAKAIEELGAAVPEVSPQSRDAAGKKSDAAQAVIREDAAVSQKEVCVRRGIPGFTKILKLRRARRDVVDDQVGDYIAAFG